MKHFTRSICLFTAALILAAPAFAVDGVTLINQATVQGAGGFPYNINQSGSYRLSGNLVAASTSAINITAPNVTLDLNGFTISCTGCTAANQPGIAGSQPGTEILNGTVTGFNTSDCIDTGTQARLDHVTMSQCDEGVWPAQGTGDVTILNSTISGVLGDGVSGAHVLVVNTMIGGYQNTGITATTVTVSNSSIVGGFPGTEGIRILGSGVVSGNAISGNQNGIYVQTGAVATITNNTISGSVNGIETSGAAVVGSNAFAGNTNDFGTTTLAVSQHNNVCSNHSGC
jgi:parallel beta-helix repeat protein